MFSGDDECNDAEGGTISIQDILNTDDWERSNVRCISRKRSGFVSAINLKTRSFIICDNEPALSRRWIISGEACQMTDPPSGCFYQDSHSSSPSHWAHHVTATLNQRQWRWFNVAATSFAQWGNNTHSNRTRLLQRFFTFQAKKTFSSKLWDALSVCKNRRAVRKLISGSSWQCR